MPTYGGPRATFAEFDMGCPYIQGTDGHWNNEHVQQEHSRARFNANANRRVAYRNSVSDEPNYPLQVTVGKGFHAFLTERMYGCPAFWLVGQHPCVNFNDISYCRF